VHSSSLTRALLVVLLLGAGCKRAGTEAPPVRRCAYVHDTYVCWGLALEGERCADGACLATKAGARPKRTATPFACSGERCTQTRPRQPDDGDWECSEGAGVTVCRGGLGAAGVSAGPPEEGWICGDRRVTDSGSYPRVCVDFAPDPPPGTTRASCHYVYSGGLGRRECTRAPEPQVGDACMVGAPNACPTGTTCIGSVCLPREPQVGCFFDQDCQGAACVFGTCQPRS